MSRSKYCQKLDGVEKVFVLHCFVCGMTYREVMNVLAEEFGIDVSYHALHYHKKRNEDRIAEIRRESPDELSVVPFASRPMRVIYLSLAAKKLYKNGKFRDFEMLLKHIEELLGGDDSAGIQRALSTLTREIREAAIEEDEMEPEAEAGDPSS